MVETCKSTVCKDRLSFVWGEIQKANRVTKCLMTEIEEARVAAGRHILHLKVLKEYQRKSGKSVLTDEDVERMFREEEDVEMKESSSLTKESSALTPQTLSPNGFTDSDSDYNPDS